MRLGGCKEAMFTSTREPASGSRKMGPCSAKEGCFEEGLPHEVSLHMDTRMSFPCGPPARSDPAQGRLGLYPLGSPRAICGEDRPASSSYVGSTQCRQTGALLSKYQEQHTETVADCVSPVCVAPREARHLSRPRTPSLVAEPGLHLNP